MNAALAIESDAEMDITALADGLVLSDDGIWHGAGQESVSYGAGSHATCFALERESFWFRHRNACLLALMRRLPPAGTLFDIGGGNGFVAVALANAGYPVALVEPGADGVRHARQRGLPLIIHATLKQARFRTAVLPSAGLFDVLEHVEDDLGFLREIHRCLEPGGRLYLTVPACPWLWSHDDVAAGHFRRYTLDGLLRTLAAAHFAPLFASYFFSILPLPLFALRSVPSLFGRRALPAASYRKLHRERSTLSEAFWQAEARAIARGRRIPIGTSCLVAAEAR